MPIGEQLVKVCVEMRCDAGQCVPCRGENFEMFRTFLPRDAMHNRGMCPSVCLSVCLSVGHVRELCQNE